MIQSTSISRMYHIESSRKSFALLPLCLQNIHFNDTVWITWASLLPYVHQKAIYWVLINMTDFTAWILMVNEKSIVQDIGSRWWLLQKISFWNGMVDDGWRRNNAEACRGVEKIFFERNYYLKHFIRGFALRQLSKLEQNRPICTVY